MEHGLNFKCFLKEKYKQTMVPNSLMIPELSYDETGEYLDNIFELENDMSPIIEHIRPYLLDVHTVESETLWHPLEEILADNDPTLYNQIFHILEVGLVPITLTFVLILVLRYEPAPEVLRNVPDMEERAEAVLNNPIVQNGIFNNIAEALPVVIDNEPGAENLIEILQNFGLASDQWYDEIGRFNLNGIDVDPATLAMLADIGFI